MEMDRGSLTTEQRNPRSTQLDRLTVAEAFDVINTEDAGVAGAVAAARPQICSAIELITERLRGGGRLIYVGAGTSGRLGVLDAAECPPTFLTDPEMVRGIIAGGESALTRSIEGAEDHPEEAVEALDSLNLSRQDVVFAIATGGTTPFAHGAVAYARNVGAATVFLACVPTDQVEDDADLSIRVITGPEVVAGSTRMKAGTATKMVLNLISTITMVRLGKVFENLMVDVSTGGNAKLIERGVRIIQTVTGAPQERAISLLDAANGRVKVAIAMHRFDLDRMAAEKLLNRHGGRLADVMGEARTAGAHDA
jgi:N-acetylmuramic acid 6-phosphate etherase